MSKGFCPSILFFSQRPLPGRMPSPYELSDQVVFFLSQAAGKAVFDHRVHAPLQFRSCANQLRVQQRRKSFDHRVGSLC